MKIDWELTNDEIEMIIDALGVMIETLKDYSSHNEVPKHENLLDKMEHYHTKELS